MVDVAAVLGLGELVAERLRDLAEELVAVLAEGHEVCAGPVIPTEAELDATFGELGDDFIEAEIRPLQEQEREAVVPAAVPVARRGLVLEQVVGAELVPVVRADEPEAAETPAEGDAEEQIVAAARAVARQVAAGQLDPDAIDEKLFAGQLATAGMPDPDLLIRTAGEMRISNFLLWQVSYAELWVTSQTWPEFGTAELDQAIDAFRARERRFGGLTQP